MPGSNHTERTENAVRFFASSAITGPWRVKRMVTVSGAEFLTGISSCTTVIRSQPSPKRYSSGLPGRVS